MADITLIGNIGQDPTTKPTSKGEITVFSIAVNQGYGENETTTWYNAAIFNEGLQAWAQANLHKGSKGVAITGPLTEKQGNNPGQVFRDVIANRIGLVEWAERSKRAEPVAVAAASSDGDDY